VVGLQALDGLGGPCFPVLDPLGLVQNDGVRLQGLDCLQVAGHDVVVHDLEEALGAYRRLRAAAAPSTTRAERSLNVWISRAHWCLSEVGQITNARRTSAWRARISIAAMAWMVLAQAHLVGDQAPASSGRKQGALRW